MISRSSESACSARRLLEHEVQRILRSRWRGEEAANVRRLPAAAVPQKGVNIGGTTLANFTKRYGNRHFRERFDSCCLPP
jgi:hypothetical protein